MKALDHNLLQAILQEIDTNLNQGILPVHNGHLQKLSREGEVLEYLIVMKKEGLISGDLTFSYAAGSSPQVVTLSGTGQ